ncbi:MAG TPA: hypothetical protein VF503_12105 [Sphingobium sp.]|uniref:hypothetical protein n=1 Tax=Sphingobium sp. TaxID=1912891 RepID=UPI002ED6838A
MTGDTEDILTRIKALLPRWFGDDSAILDALLYGPAMVLAFLYSLYAYAKLQTRILTATDGWLDMIAADFFGDALLRKPGQSDASYRARILANLLRERATRQAIINVLTELTGRAPVVIEATRPTDTGAYGVGYAGYGVAGAYGSLQLPYQAFVTAFRPTNTGVQNVAGYGSGPGGYQQGGQLEYASLDMIEGNITDADIYAAIDAVAPVGTIIWTRIQS